MKKIRTLNITGTTVFLIIMLIVAGCLIFNIRDSFKRMKYGVAKGVWLGGTLLERKMEHEVYDLVSSVSKVYFLKPKNAYWDRLTGQILPEINGQKVDVSATVKMIMNSKPHTVHDPVIVPLEPEITTDVYKNIRTKKGSFRTGFGGGNRAHNIFLAASSINNCLLAPGEVFSFNKATMPRDAEHGYKKAPVIVGGTVVPGYGGGICQVSSTLYNAVKNAELEVVERFPHSMPVDYVPKGMDATVSEYLDFKFRNNRDKFILIKTGTYGYTLVVEIWE
ncbi:MAG: VanW family protein [Firmicutes bacterium]|nr:VanW family protein [Bacillota bacterium]